MSRRAPSLAWSMALGLVLLGFAPRLRAETAPEVPDNDHSPLHQALLDYKTGKYDDARAAIETAEQAKPGDIPTEILKAKILTELGDFTGAEQALRPLLTSDGPLEVQLALGDVLLRKRSFDRAAKYYGFALQAKPDDPEIILKLIYAKIGASDLLDAAKYASQLKPLDPDHPSYYFAKAALAQATGKTQEVQDDIQTARTIYGITVTNRHLKTYLEVFASPEKSPAATETTPPPLVNPAPAGAKP